MSEHSGLESTPAPEVSESEAVLEERLDAKREKIESILRELGFDEAPEMKEIRQQAVVSPGVISDEMLTRWRDQADALIEAISDRNLFAKAQLGCQVARAQFYLDARMVEEFYSAIDDAREYAYQLGLDDVVDVLDSL